MALLIRLLRLLSLLVAILGVVLYFTIRDSVPLVSTVFYALPLPACAALFLASALLALSRPKRALLPFVLSLATAGFWLATTYGLHRQETGDIRVGTWNLGRPRHPFQPLVDVISRERPDFLALIEIGGLNTPIGQQYSNPLPGYQCHVFPGGMACLTTGNVISARPVPVAGGGQAIEVHVAIRGTTFRFLITDLSADVFLVRSTEFASYSSLAGSHPRTILLGDFNTPLESVYMSDLRKHFWCSSEQAGRGFRETWFFMLPLLSLDQIWVSRDLLPVSSRRVFTLTSDHAPVVSDLRIVPPVAPATQ